MILLQNASTQVIDVVTSVRDVSIVGLMAAAIGVLWRSLSKKDDQLLESIKAVTAALTTSATAQGELREIIKESVRSKDELRQAIHELSLEMKAKPCLIRPS